MSTADGGFNVTKKKQRRVRSMVQRLVTQTRHGNGFMSSKLLKIFRGVALSLSLAVPLARFRTRVLYVALAYAKREKERAAGEKERERE